MVWVSEGLQVIILSNKIEEILSGDLCSAMSYGHDGDNSTQLHM